jgi:FixJ family two-component response regulator
MRELGVKKSFRGFSWSNRPSAYSCLVLDVGLPGLSGLDLQKRLAEAGKEIPIIFITDHRDIPMSVRAMKAGAVEFLTKPFRDQDLIEAIQQGIERDRAARRRAAKLTEQAKHCANVLMRSPRCPT